MGSLEGAGVAFAGAGVKITQAREKATGAAKKKKKKKEEEERMKEIKIRRTK